jgi:hypothetical protein
MARSAFCLLLVAACVMGSAAAVDDTDGDGVIDSRDACPRTPPEGRPGDTFDAEVGCLQSQVDLDLDGVCNRLVRASPAHTPLSPAPRDHAHARSRLRGTRGCG